MIIKIEKSFDKDVEKIKNKRVLNEVKNFILVIEKINSLHELSNIKKLKVTNHIIELEWGIID